MKQKSSYRELTKEEREWANRLMAIFLRRKKSDGLTQAKLGELVGISQSAVGQYLNGVIPLNLSAMVTFAMVLKCQVQDIDPACPHHILTTPEEIALNAAYQDLKNRGEVASQKALLGVAELSPAYHVTLQRSQERVPAESASSTEKK